VADRAQHRGVHLQLAGGAERGLREVDLEADQRVLAPAHPRARAPPGTGRATRSLPAEEGVHDVGERETLARTEAPGATAERVATEVVHPALLRVGEHLVGARDVLEPLLCLGVRVHVRVELTGKTAVGLLDRVVVGIAGDAEGLVEVLAHSTVTVLSAH
jgi:hypothetical protein